MRQLAVDLLQKGESVGILELEASNRRTALGLMSTAVGKNLHLGEHNKEELDKGRAEGRMRLRTMQFKSAQSGSAAMLIWLGKQILGQKDQQEIAVVDEEEKRLSEEDVDAMLNKITGNENSGNGSGDKASSPPATGK